MSIAPTPIYSPGLEGVIAGKSAICTVGRTGDDLRYRGYSVTELSRRNVPWDEIAYMLIYNRRANAPELAKWRADIRAARELPESLVNALRSIPADSQPM